MKQKKILLIIIVTMLMVASACLGSYLALTLPTGTPDQPLPQLTTGARPTTGSVTAPTTGSTTLPGSITTGPTLPPVTTFPPVTTLPPVTTQPLPTTQPTTVPPETTQPPQPPLNVELNAKNAFAYDLNAENFLQITGDLDAQVEPASITKLFTAYVALQYLQEDTVITAGEEVSWIDPGSSRAFISRGHKLTVKMLVQGMIIPSGNDAAYIIAVAAGRAIAEDANLDARTALDTFLAEINRQAQLLGLTGTHFVNPDGMNAEEHYTTLRDLLTIAKLALETPVILDAAQTQTMRAVFASGQWVQWTNSNLLLDPENEDFYCEDAFGLKTGSTSSAGKCLLSAFRREDRVIIICVMGCTKDANRYQDTLALYHAIT